MCGPSKEEQTMLRIALLALALALSVTASNAGEKRISPEDASILDIMMLVGTQEKVHKHLARIEEHREARCPLLDDDKSKEACNKAYAAVKSLHRTLLDRIDGMIATIHMPESPARKKILLGAFGYEIYNAVNQFSEIQLADLDGVYEPPTRQLGALETK